MSTEPKRGRFEITHHAELSDRGGFVLGNILDGVVRPGMLVSTSAGKATLTIRGVESLDDLSERRHWHALIFAERPTLEFVKHAFPVGSIVNVATSAS